MMKTPDQSYTEQVQLLNQGDMNGSRRLFGGKLMQWIDMLAAVVARRHANRNVTTASVDHLEFRAPAKANDLVVLTGRIVFAGRTSMEICVKSYVEDLEGTRRLINQAHVIIVALDENGEPCEVPKVNPVTEEDRIEYELARKRKESRDRKKAPELY